MGEGTRPTSLGQGGVSEEIDIADESYQPVIEQDFQAPIPAAKSDMYLFGETVVLSPSLHTQNPYKVDYDAKLNEVPQEFRQLFAKLPEGVSYSAEKICIFYQAYQFSSARSDKPLTLSVVQKEFAQTIALVQYLESRYQVMCEKQLVLDMALACLVSGDLKSVNEMQMQLDTVAFDAHCSELTEQAVGFEFQLQFLEIEKQGLTQRLMVVCESISKLVHTNMSYWDHDRRDLYDDVYSDVSRLEEERNELVEKLAELEVKQRDLESQLRAANQALTLEQYKILQNTKAPQALVDQYLLSLAYHPEALPESLVDDFTAAKTRFLAKAEPDSLQALSLTNPTAALSKAVEDYNQIRLDEWVLITIDEFEKLNAEYYLSDGGQYDFWEMTGKSVPDELYSAPAGFTPIWVQGDGTKTNDWVFVAKEKTGYRFQPVPRDSDAALTLDFESSRGLFLPLQERVVPFDEVSTLRADQAQVNMGVQMALFANQSFRDLSALGDAMLVEVSSLTAMIQHGVVGFTKDDEFLTSLQNSASTLMEFYYEHEGELRLLIEDCDGTIKILEGMAQRSGNREFAAQIQELKDKLQTVVTMVENDEIPTLCEAMMDLEDSYDYDQATYFLQTTVLITATAVVGGVLCMTGVGAIFGPAVFASLPGMLLAAGLSGFGGVAGQEFGTAMSGEFFDTGLKSHWQRYRGGEISDEELAATYLESWACQSAMTFAFLGAGRMVGIAGKSMSQSANQWTASAGMSILRVGSFIQRGTNRLFMFNPESQLGKFFVTSVREVGSEFVEEAFEGAAHQIHPVLGGIASIIDCLDGRNIQVELYGAGVTIAGQFQIPGSNTIAGHATYTAGKKSTLISELKLLFPNGTVTESNELGNNDVELEFVNEQGQKVRLQFHSSEESYALRLSAANTILQSEGVIRGYGDLLTNVLGLMPLDEGTAYRVNADAQIDWVIEQFKMRGMPLVSQDDTAEDPYIEIYTGDRVVRIYTLNTIDAKSDLPAVGAIEDMRLTDYAARQTVSALVVTIGLEAEPLAVLNKILDEDYGKDELPDLCVRLDLVASGILSFEMTSELQSELKELAGEHEVSIQILYTDSQGDNQLAEMHSTSFVGNVKAAIPMAAAPPPLLHPLADYFALYADDPALQAELMQRAGKQKFTVHETSSNFELDPNEVECLAIGNSLAFADKVRVAREQRSSTISWTVKIFGLGQLGQECGDVLQELLPQLKEAQNLGLKVDVNFLGFDVQLYNLNMAETMAAHNIQSFIDENDLQNTLQYHFNFQFADLTDPRSADRAVVAGNPDITIWRHTWLAADGYSDELDDQPSAPAISANDFNGLMKRLKANLNKPGVILISETVGAEPYFFAEVVRTVDVTPEPVSVSYALPPALAGFRQEFDSRMAKATSLSEVTAVCAQVGKDLRDFADYSYNVESEAAITAVAGLRSHMADTTMRRALILAREIFASTQNPIDLHVLQFNILSVQTAITSRQLVLNPELELQYQKFLQELDAAMREQPLEPLPPVVDTLNYGDPNLLQTNLTATLGESAVRYVVDYGTGNANWMRSVRASSWLAADAIVVGTELPQSASHQGELAETQARDWEGLTVVQNPDDPNWPQPGSADLVHASFVEVYGVDAGDRDISPAGMLQEYDDWLAPGGWMLIARHRIQHGDIHLYTKWLESHGYEWQVIPGHHVPHDYPKPEWWAIREGMQPSKADPNLVLILAHKPIEAELEDVSDPKTWDGEAIEPSDPDLTTEEVVRGNPDAIIDISYFDVVTQGLLAVVNGLSEQLGRAQIIVLKRKPDQKETWDWQAMRPTEGQDQGVAGDLRVIATDHQKTWQWQVWNDGQQSWVNLGSEATLAALRGDHLHVSLVHDLLGKDGQSFAIYRAVFPNWPRLMLSGNRNLPLNEQDVFVMPTGEVVVGVEPETWAALLRDVPSELSQIFVGESFGEGLYYRVADHDVILIENRIAAMQSFKSQRDNRKFVSGLTELQLRSDAEIQARLMLLAQNSCAALLATLQSLAQENAAAEPPTVLLAGHDNFTDINQNTFINDLLEDYGIPFEERSMVSGQIFVPQQDLQSTVGLLQNQLVGSEIMVNEEARVLLRYQTVDGVRQQIEVSASAVPEAQRGTDSESTQQSPWRSADFDASHAVPSNADGPNGREIRSVIPDGGRQLPVTYFDTVSQGLAPTLNELATTLGVGRSLIFTPDRSHQDESWHWMVMATSDDSEALQPGQLRAMQDSRGVWVFAEWDDVTHIWITIDMRTFLANVRGSPNDVLPIPDSWQTPRDIETTEHPDGLVPALQDQAPISRHFPDWPNLFIGRDFQTPLIERSIVDVPNGPLVVAMGPVSFDSLATAAPSFITRVQTDSGNFYYTMTVEDRELHLVSRTSQEWMSAVMADVGRSCLGSSAAVFAANQESADSRIVEMFVADRHLESAIAGLQARFPRLQVERLENGNVSLTFAIDGNHWLIGLRAVVSPLSDAEMLSPTITSARILEIQTAHRNREALLVVTAHGNLAVRVGYSTAVSPLPGDHVLGHTHYGAAIDRSQMMPSPADVMAVVLRQKSSELVIHRFGVTLYGSGTTIQEDDTSITVSGATLFETADVLIGFDAQNNVVITAADGSVLVGQELVDANFVNEFTRGGGAILQRAVAESGDANVGRNVSTRTNAEELAVSRLRMIEVAGAKHYLALRLDGAPTSMNSIFRTIQNGSLFDDVFAPGQWRSTRLSQLDYSFFMILTPSPKGQVRSSLGIDDFLFYVVPTNADRDALFAALDGAVAAGLLTRGYADAERAKIITYQEFIDRGGVPRVAADASVQTRLYELALQSRDSLMASLTAVAQDVVGAAMPIASVVGTSNGTLGQQEFISEVLRLGKAPFEVVLVESELSVPVSRFNETILRVVRDLPGALIQNNDEGRAILIYRSPNGVQQQILIKAIECPLTEQEMRSFELPATRILTIQDENEGQEVLMVRTAFGHLALRVGSNELQGDMVLLRARSGDSHDEMLMMPSVNEIRQAQAQGNQQAILHASGVTVFDGNTIVKDDTALEQGQAGHDAILYSTLDVMIEFSADGNVTVRELQSNSPRPPRVEAETFDDPANVIRFRSPGSLGTHMLDLPGQPSRSYDVATMKPADVLALKAVFTTVVGEPLLTVDSGDRYHRVTEFLAVVASLRPDLVKDILYLYTDVIETMSLSESASSAVILALARTYVSRPDVWQQSHNRQWIIRCLNQDGQPSQNAVAILQAILDLNSVELGMYDLLDLSEDPNISASAKRLIIAMTE